MRNRCIIAAIAFASAGAAAFAGDVYVPSRSAEEGMVLRQGPWTGLSGAQVEEDVLAARRDGTLTNISRGYAPRYPFSSPPVLTKSSQQVEQEFFDWKAQPVRPDGKKVIPGVGMVDREAP